MKRPKDVRPVVSVKPTPITPKAFTVLVVGPAGKERDECVASIQAAGLRTVAAEALRVQEYVKDLIAQGVAK